MFGRLHPRRGAHYATTAHLCAVMPFQASTGLGGRGVYMGRDASGAAFCFDPFELYERGVLTGPAMVVLGEIGRGKSAFVKAYLHRQCGVFGRSAVVVSPKRGEYDRLAAALGVEPIRLAPRGGVILNPLASPEGDEAVELGALRSVAAATLARMLTPAEDASLAQSLRHVRSLGQEPTLPRVVWVLLDPPASVWRERWRSKRHFEEESREAALALDRLCDGDAAGMFDGETSVGISLDAPLVVLDLSAVADSSADSRYDSTPVCLGVWYASQEYVPGNTTLLTTRPLTVTMFTMRRIAALNRIISPPASAAPTVTNRRTGVPDPNHCPSRDRSKAASHAGASSRSLV